jgi:hypothetical protein
MAQDDWRVRIELENPGGFLERLGIDLGTDAHELARELEDHRLVVTHDEDTVFVYTSSGLQAEQARKVVEAELAEQGIKPKTIAVEHWLADETRWDGEPAGESWEEEVVERGYAPWEVRVECDSHEEAEALAEQLENEGYSVARRWRYVIVGANSREEAAALAARLHGEVEPGGELVYEVPSDNPFAVFAFRNPF